MVLVVLKVGYEAGKCLLFVDVAKDLVFLSSVSRD